MKKLLTLALVATLMLTVCLFTGCGQNPENAKFKCEQAETIIAVNQGDKLEDKVSGLTFTLDPDVSYIKWVNGEKTTVTVGWDGGKSYEECVALGMSVTGFDSSRPTADGETRLIRFSLYGYTCTVPYTVAASNG